MSLNLRQRKYKANRLKGMNQYNAARAAGYSELTSRTRSHKLEASTKIDIQNIIEQAGLTDKRLMEIANEGLESTRLYGAEAVEHADWMARHKFWESICELKGIIKKNGITINDNSRHETNIYNLPDKLKAARERVMNARNGVTEPAAH